MECSKRHQPHAAGESAAKARQPLLLRTVDAHSSLREARGLARTGFSVHR
jgi:hypothetical protein